MRSPRIAPLKLRDYGRIDMRLTKKGVVYVIEANPNPWLASSAEFAMASKKAGYSYTDMIEKIVELARARSMSALRKTIAPNPD